MSALAVFVMGGFGALARHALQVLMPTHSGQFPWATFVTNTLGCALTGLLCTMLAMREGTSPLLRLAVMTGFLGGFTTFSAFAWESLELWQSGRPTQAALYVLATFVGCGVGVAVGAWAMRA